ncbi:site-specific integrase [Microbacterium forte]|uniref:site-specific integrase n=1 Tax=Microbacterium forte TaxID=2982533 RepID=UPI00289322D5|nr:tyrosine-type recombinase/integrase [Microbacterium sp. A(2022)]
MTGPQTFQTKREALDHLAAVRSDRMRGTYIDHRAGLVPFGPYAADWIAHGGRRGALAPKTRDLYETTLAGPLAPLREMPIASITPSQVRAWYTKTGRALAASAKRQGGDGSSRLRQAYSLLRAVMATAVRDGMIPANPCQIDRAGAVKHAERPYLSPDDLARILVHMSAKWHLPLRVALGAHLRLGELLGLQRRDYVGGVLTVERQIVRVGGEEIETGTKSGKPRKVVLPPSIAAALEAHLLASSGFGLEPMFPGPGGERFTGGAIGQAWRKAAGRAGLSGIRLHDLRHASLTLAAQAGATTRELMDRAGHSTARAALIYQHAAEERSGAIAAAMDALSGGSMMTATGTTMARQAISASDLEVDLR